MMDDIFAEYEAERLKALEVELAAEDAFAASAEGIALKAKQQADEHAKGVRLGWWDEDGNSIVSEDEDEDEDEEIDE